jgi:hypothetical protein
MGLHRLSADIFLFSGGAKNTSPGPYSKHSARKVSAQENERQLIGDELQTYGLMLIRLYVTGGKKVSNREYFRISTGE